jgi:hypothetical protein
LRIPSSDPFQQGLDYLYQARVHALDADMVDIVFDFDQRSPICTWIGTHIDRLNAKLYALLQICHNCFHTTQQPPFHILAAPLADRYGIDGLCNLDTATILIDVGRVHPDDWLALVMHEYAHAHANSPGHHAQFAQSLSHLCLGLAIAPPVSHTMLPAYPPYRSTAAPLAFWRGETDWIVNDCYSFAKGIS